MLKALQSFNINSPTVGHFNRRLKMAEYRYIVWVGGCDDYYVNYNDAKRDADEWIAKGYDDVIIEEICNAKG